MYSIKITSIEKLHIQSDNSDVLAVAFNVMQDGAIVVSYNHGFPLNTPNADIVTYFKEWLAAYEQKQADAVANADRDAAHAVADETIAALSDAEITNNP